MGFRLSREAVEDISHIIEQGMILFGQVQAERYYDELFAIFDLLAANPHMARARFELSPPLRVHPHKAHLIFYRIENDDHILILGVRHEHEDWQREYRH
ncbi:type II toxin-antitoxin system RelE/ParE family toxin [Phyllobacterium leguminum]|uniref:Toxin n=1 Tax=Phyllobacterium leguminum TaxID=314237 RepID=A0A318T1S7_9HYPH|nr:type II toxin-antitoxin system RelE/ParE family toxin [Phyllobacterium leguminum]PYE86559.1 toxin ParE1/3/4 [Phyllobacterium leguminum]